MPKFSGSKLVEVTPEISIGGMSPEASDLINVIMQEWKQHLADPRETNGEKYEPGHYSFTHWLVRWSGLVQPTELAERKARAMEQTP